jgi:hypothetical protein
MEKKDTIAETMRVFMASGPSVKDYPTYRALNDYVGKLHGKAEGVCQALAGEKAWAWTPDQVTGTWRKATDVEVESRRAKAATKVHGVRTPKVMSDADRAALDAQVKALEQVANPALAPLLADLKAKQASDDAARKGSLKDRLQTAIDKMGMELAVKTLESLSVAIVAEMEADTAETDAEPGNAEPVEA